MGSLPKMWALLCNKASILHLAVIGRMRSLSLQDQRINHPLGYPSANDPKHSPGKKNLLNISIDLKSRDQDKGK